MLPSPGLPLLRVSRARRFVRRSWSRLGLPFGISHEHLFLTNGRYISSAPFS